MNYAEFLASKRLSAKPVGFDVDPSRLNASLFDFQSKVVTWAAKKGRAAIFADCGLGKTLQQLEWARLCVEETGKSALIVTPLAVAAQTEREAKKFSIDAPVKRIRSMAEVDGVGVYVTNYHILSHFGPESFGALVLDESSILKSFDGKTRREITKFASSIDFRLACTATPAPNDLIEIRTHSEFLGLMKGKEILALFFRQDGNSTHEWRLKGHAAEDFWDWLATWAVAYRAPEDIGFRHHEGFDLPELRWHEHIVESPGSVTGRLFDVGSMTLSERRKARKATIAQRVEKTAELVANEPEEQWLIWCDLNDESERLTSSIPGAVEIRGSHDPDYKADTMMDFADGKVRVLVTKPSIAGHGMNWQQCARMAFVGLSDSYEQLYQATRRSWRFGQTRPVDAHVVVSTADGAVRANILRKEKQSTRLFNELVSRAFQEKSAMTEEAGNVTKDADGSGWKLLLGDCVERIREVDDDSVGLSIFSPPFPGMYAYTDSPRDVGNVRDYRELMKHFRYVMPELLRITLPGRHCCVHLTQEPVFKHQAGHVGMRDFRGSVIREMEESGWIYYGEVTIDKNPQLKASRTKEQTLLFKTLSTDSTACRPALADYLLQFRKPGDNPIPVPSGIHPRYNPDDGWITQDEWIEWAAPVWYRKTDHYPGGISETDVLQYRNAKDADDEKHLCPLQLGVIERAIKLWSAPGDLVFSPFAGIGSEGFQAVKLNRQFVGIELKPSYWQVACRNLEAAERLASRGSLFDQIEEVAL